MTLSADDARALARRTLEMSGADETEVLVFAEDKTLTRFANNHIHQNVAEENVSVSIRAVRGRQIGVASTNRTDEASMRACAASALQAASAAPEDRAFPGLPEPVSEPIATPERAYECTRGFDAEARARAVGAIVEQSSERGLVAAGTVSRAEHVTAVANSKGIDVGMATTSLTASVLSMGNDGGSGWGSFTAADAGLFAPEALGDEAATLAERSANPTDFEPGTYSVVLAPEAVADILQFLGYVGFSAKAVEEGTSFMSGNMEAGIGSELVTIVDDALASHALGITFDYEGCPKQPTTLLEYGVAKRPVTDSYWASKTGWSNSGHALPAPNPHGPMPWNLEMAPGTATIDELIASVKRGVYVTRFHYVNVEDPVPVLLTGMTRDGTFLIEDGHLTRPLKNLRFTQSATEALWWTSGVTRERSFFGGDEGAVLAPGILVDRFNFTGQTT
ncbi:MAG: TldD/PmbA family protein [Actinomycetota bacterium]|nr:TldD/PmbA family protein [Actinomycetota bacterium]